MRLCLCIIHGGDGEGSAVLRRLLALYADLDDAAACSQIEGVVSITGKPIAVRLWSPGPIAFGRGIEVTIALGDQAFEGGIAVSRSGEDNLALMGQRHG